MPWPTVCALSLALALSFSGPLSHRHTGAYMSVYVLTVAAIVISFLLYECVCPCVCVCVFGRATFFVALFRLLRWHLMKQKWHLCKSWRLSVFAVFLLYFCSIFVCSIFRYSQQKFKNETNAKFYTHASHVGSCLSKLTRRLCIEWKNVDVDVDCAAKRRTPGRLSHISVSVWRAFCSAVLVFSWRFWN